MRAFLEDDEDDVAVGPQAGEDDEVPEARRLADELLAVDVGPQQGDNDAAVDVVDGPDSAPGPATAALPKKVGPLVDEELRKAQKRKSNSSRKALLGRAGSNFLAAASGGTYKPDNGFWDALERRGAGAVTDLQTKRATERQGRMDAQTEALNAARIAKMGQSKAPGRYGILEKSLGVAPGSLDGADAATVKSMVDLVKAGKATEAAKLAKEEEHKYQLGRDELSRTYGAAEKAKDRASHERSAALLAGKKDAVNDGKTNVAGLEKVEGATPTEDDAKKVKGTLDAANRMRPMIAQLRQLHADNGTELPVTAVGNKMQSLGTALKLEAKTIAELGALSGPDMELMNSLAGMDPTSFGSNIMSLFGVDNTQEALKQLDKWINTSVAAKLKTYGYRTPAPKNMTLETPGAAPGKSHGKVVSETKTVREYEDGYLEEKT